VQPDVQTAVQAQLRAFMEKWLADSLPTDELETIEQEGISPSGLLAPFHDALVPGIRLLNERGFSTRLGNLHERIAVLIASAAHAEVRRAYDLAGSIPVLAREFITQRIAQLERREARPDAAHEREELLRAFGAQVDAATRIDLYVRTHAGDEHFFEIKSPAPNKGQCIEMKQRLMTALAIRQSRTAWARWAIPYNPYGKGTYRHPFALPFFDLQDEVLLGPDFWNFVGDNASTYDDLLTVYREVGETYKARIRELRDRLIV
jgi:Type II restriction endonuclease, TdeIII